MKPTHVYFHRGPANGSVESGFGPAPAVIDKTVETGTSTTSASYRRTNYLRTVLHDGRALSCRVFMPSALVTPEGNLL